MPHICRGAAAAATTSTSFKTSSNCCHLFVQLFLFIQLCTFVFSSFVRLISFSSSFSSNFYNFLFNFCFVYFFRGFFFVCAISSSAACPIALLLPAASPAYPRENVPNSGEKIESDLSSCECCCFAFFCNSI